MRALDLQHGHQPAQAVSQEHHVTHAQQDSRPRSPKAPSNNAIIAADERRWQAGRRSLLNAVLGGRDTEERRHRFVTLIGGRPPRTGDGRDERPELRKLGIAFNVGLGVAFLALRWPPRDFVCDNQRLVRRFP
jgi:hypothetical protein